MDKPELIIPVRMELDKALKQLQKIGQEGKNAGADTKKDMDVAKGGMDNFHSSLANLIKTQMGIGAIVKVSEVIGTEFKRVADYCKNLAMEFNDLRQAMQMVAALKGQSNSNEFTVEEVKKAAAANLTPTEWKSFQEQFQSYGGAYLEGDQARFVQHGDVSANEQSEQYQQQIAEFAKARGIPAEEIAQLGGALLEFSEGPQTVEDVVSRLGKVYKTLERALTPVAELMPQMNRVMAQGASPEEASQMLAIMSEAMPHEEKTGVVNALKAINNQILEGKGKSLGQTEDMTPLQQVQAAAKAIKERVDKGEKLKTILHEVAPDIRERNGLEGFVTWGIEAEGFDRTKGYETETPRDFVQQTLKEYEASDSGQSAKRDAQEAITKAERGAKFQDVEALLQKAKTELIQSGELETGSYGQVAKDPIGWTASWVDPEQQRINTRAIEDVREIGCRRGLTGPEFETSASGQTFGQGTRGQHSINEEIRDLLQKIEEKTGKNPALTAAPAGFSGLRQAH